jgi:hypothetical protein
MMFAALLFYGGAGVNVVQYCCIGCENKGIEAVSDKCGHDACCAKDECGSCHCGRHDGTVCSIKRVEFEWQSVDVDCFYMLPPVCDVPRFTLDYLLSQNKFMFSAVESHIDDDAPPIVLPKTYLSLLSTLVI